MNCADASVLLAAKRVSGEQPLKRRGYMVFARSHVLFAQSLVLTSFPFSLQRPDVSFILSCDKKLNMVSIRERILKGCCA